ncbi:MAG: hypothetical protein AB7K52_09790 [Phycisphaerales bacterium]
MIRPGALLCERCGYDIEGLPGSGACPECGRAVAQSLPERRPGSAWQRVGGTRAAWHAYWAAWTRPRRLFDEIRIAAPESDRRVWALTAMSDLWTAHLSIVPAAAFIGLCLALGLVEIMGAAGRAAGVLLMLGSVVLALPAMLFLGALTNIERGGIQVLGRMRGWRVTPAVADAVCAHASAGWVGGALIGNVLMVATAIVPWALSEGEPAPIAGVLKSIGAGLVIGLLWFEMLTYVGVRRCRYANHERAGRGS